MATITASLERSLQNCSLNQTTRSRRGNGGGSGGLGRSSSSDSPENYHYNINQSRNNSRRPINDDVVAQSNVASSSDDNSTFVELNSHVSLPYHWEQCLDLKTGEIYYINWSNGMKAKEDPRTTGYNGDYSSEDDDDEDDDDDEEEEESNCYDDSGGSSTESSPCSSSTKKESFRSIKKHQHLNQDSVLVVAGCKSCLMYYMVPKHVEDCPKCSGQLLHFAANNSSP
ncbi:protein CURLY FLAG LEAF 1 isoform X1 [Amaranthus tricolor]|uniref:protein CURLY FLAG LEAF 1 isoform X1 n=1 Tax=Amaranthus tricolor TaxID=29722 RepID=UPI002587ABC0|nr:protein CURLY FLAG LEAF 1 isoform X1 [Amaranthus tricolor]